MRSVQGNILDVIYTSALSWCCSVSFVREDADEGESMPEAEEEAKVRVQLFSLLPIGWSSGDSVQATFFASHVQSEQLAES